MTINDEAGPRPERHFARAVKEALDEKDMSQQALADAMAERGYKFHQATIYKILNGSRKVTLDEAVTMATILEVDLETMTVPLHETQIRRSMSGANKALTDIRNLTFRFMNHHRNILQLLDGRDDWEPATRKAAETWRATGGPAEGVERGRADWERHAEQHRSASITFEEINAEVEEGRRRRGEHPEA